MLQFHPLTQFNDWAAAWYPGVKTKALAWIVGLPSAGLLVLQMFSEVGWDWKVVVGDYAPYAGVAVAALLYWFRLLADRSVIAAIPVAAPDVA